MYIKHFLFSGIYGRGGQFGFGKISFLVEKPSLNTNPIFGFIENSNLENNKYFFYITLKP